MIFFTFFLLIAIIHISLSASNLLKDSELQCPGGIRIRKEFRDMTVEEWTTFRKAILAVYAQNEKKRNLIDYWTRIHLDHVPDAHNTAQFFPWHRYFVKIFEDQLRLVHPNVTIPYWVIFHYIFTP